MVKYREHKKNVRKTLARIEFDKISGNTVVLFGTLQREIGISYECLDNQ